MYSLFSKFTRKLKSSLSPLSLLLLTLSAYGGAFSINAPSNVTEASGASMTFKVTLTAFPSNDCKSTQDYNVLFSTTNSGTATPGADFVPKTNRLISIRPVDNKSSGDCGSVDVNVTILDDNTTEGDESIVAQLSSPSNNATLLITTNAGLIIDNDANLTITINDASIAEQNVDVNATVNIVLNKPAPFGGIALDYNMSNGTATSPNDYIATSGTITIPEGTSSYPLKIIIKGDEINETAEKFYVTINNASAGVILDNNSTVTIFDDDSLGSCSPYVGLITLNEYQNNPHYFDTSRHKTMGNYVELKYIDQLVKKYITANWKLSVYSSAGVQEILWSKRDTSCTDPYYEVFQFDSNIMGARDYIVLTDENGREIDVLNINNSTNYSPKCTHFIYDTDFPSALPQNKEIFRFPDGTGDWSDVGLGSNSEGSRCLYVPSNGYDLVYTQFDAIDDDAVVPSLVSSSIDVPLKTKIVNKPFSIKILSLETAIVGSIGTLKPISTTIKVYFANGIGGSLLDSTGYSTSFNNASIATLSNISLARASKNTKLVFEYCQDSTGALHNWDQCFDINNNDWRRRSFSRNTFAIRPNDFNSTITTNQSFIAEQNTTITFRADQFSGTGSTDYNETMNTSFVVDINISDANKTCANPSIQINPNITFANGIASNVYHFSNVGDFNLSIHENNGTEFAIVDATDTPDTDRFITPYTQQLKVIPHHFTLDGNFTNNANNFTYLSNFEIFTTPQDRNMSAILDLNISAQGLNNTILSNYTSACYAQDGNLTMTLIAPLNINPSTALTKIFWYDELHNDINGSRLLLATPYIMDMNHTQFDSIDTNGSSKMKYRINFDRNETQTVNPFYFNLQSIKATDVDLVEGNTTLDQNATFYYGRAHAPDYRFWGNTGNALIYYEVYCKDCNRTAMGITGNESVDAINWYQNTLHVTADGNVTQFSSIGMAKINGSDIDTSGMIINGRESKTMSTTIVPYVDNIEMIPSSWLIYPTVIPRFTVEFYSSGSWAGEGSVKSGVKEGKHTNTNDVNRTNRRLSW